MNDAQQPTDAWHAPSNGYRDDLGGETPPVLTIPDPIEPAIAESLRNENRLYVLTCENTILNFVRSRYSFFIIFLIPSVNQ